MKLLVTGGAGFIGSNFIHYWLKNHPDDQIVNLDVLTYAGHLENLKDVEGNPNYQFIKGDITYAEDVKKAMDGADVVVNFAAESITEDTYLPVYSATGTKVLTFNELWNQQNKNSQVKSTKNGEVIFLKGRQTKALSFLNGGQWMPIKAITRHWYKGKIIKLVQKWGIVKATPNHSIYSANLELVTPESNPQLLVVRNINENNRKFKGIDRTLLEILAAYITEGNATFNKANGSYIIEIGQKDKKWLESLANKIKEYFGYKSTIVKARKGKFTFYHLQVSNKKFFEYLIDSCGKYSDEKFFPNWVFDLASSEREYFWEKLLEGDGIKDKRYTTTSYKLVSQLSLLLALQKKQFTVFERNHPKYKRSFEIKSSSPNFHYGLNQKKKIEMDYEGWVYDLEIERTHNFVCGIGNVVCHNTHVDRSIIDPLKFVKTNVLGTAQLLETALDNKVKRFHHVSTDEVFGQLGPNDPPFNEDTPYNPRTPYAASKAASDHLVRAYHQTYSLPITITNCSNNFGPYQDPEKLIPRFITNLLEGQKVPLMGRGENIRDWLYVDDHSKAVEVVLQKGMVGETYCLGGEEKTNLEVTKKILEILGKGEDRIEHVEHRLGHDLRYAIDDSKLRNLGWKPEHSFDECLEKVVDWYKENEWWWKPLKEGRPNVDRVAQRPYGI